MTTWTLRASPGHPAAPGALRVAVKDLIDVAGWPTTAASRAVAATALPAPADAPCLSGLRAAEAAGTARVEGKVNLHELAYGISGINHAFGTPVNPLDPGLVPGGSSSGCAVAVGSGEADVGIGTDTGGSVRIPAACCGVAGLKTTWGRVPLEGVWPLAPGFDTVGPLARDVAGLAAGMALLEPGFAVEDRWEPVVVGRLSLGGDPVVETAVDAALAATGWKVLQLQPPDLDVVTDAALTVLDAQAWTSNARLVSDHPDGIGRDVLTRLRRAGDTDAAAVARAEEVLTAWRAWLERQWGRVELIAIPTLLGLPPRLEDAREMVRLRGLSAPVNAAGVPAVALPIPSGAPLPGSLQLIGPADSEERLLSAAAVAEAAVR